ncbi:spermidine/putrescine ABC transporter permease [Clostridium gelidum]|uniref:Spermidine/putrescine ABC transporter permease n=1 Tax=Clostridium gelidum TaxID=704125 RepID=A0ABN6J1B8_9CLOT|nr:ABC transporter permease [Clostridium gelidum]BCZ47508.1 spermidine/putrescine ABC transporter permease [Clostridium gelidum]
MKKGRAVDESIKNKKSKRKLKSKIAPTLSMVGPISFWMTIFVIVPLIYVGFMSFMTRGTYGGIEYKFTLENYKTIFDPLYFKVILNSIGIALGSSIICILIGYPFAYYLTKQPIKKRGALIMLIMIPFWTSSMVRTYSWVILLHASGIVNKFLMAIGLTKEPLQLLYNDYAVTLGIVYVLLPFAILPLYSAIEKLDKSLIEASNDLGAKPYKTFMKVTLPLTSSGIFASVILTFIPSLGYYFTADVLGGGKTLMIGNLIKNQFTTAKNWPFGAAISLVLIAITLLVLYLYSRIGDLDDLGVAK